MFINKNKITIFKNVASFLSSPLIKSTKKNTLFRQYFIYDDMTVVLNLHFPNEISLMQPNDKKKTNYLAFPIFKNIIFKNIIT